MKLHQAVKANNLQEIGRLLARGNDINERDALGNTPLHYAASYAPTLGEFAFFLFGSFCLFPILIISHVIQGYNIFSAQMNLVAYLIQHGAKLDIANNEDRTPLHFALHNNDTEVISFLLRSGADINQKNKQGCTPLHILLQSKGNKDTIQLMLKFGADVSLKDNEGRTALDYARQMSNPEIIQILLVGLFKQNHKRDLSQGIGFFRCFRRTQINYEDLTLDKILEHAHAHDNRSRRICVELDWLDREGNLNSSAPLEVVNEYSQSVESPTRLDRI